MKKVLSLICIVALSITMLAGCGPRTIEAYLEKNKAEFEEMEKEQSIEGQLEMSISAKENTLYFQAKLLISLGVEADALKEAFDGELSTTAAAIEPDLKNFKSFGVKDPIVIAEYLDKDGTLITSHEFKMGTDGEIESRVL